MRIVINPIDNVIVRNYILQSYQTIDFFRRTYPNLLFESIARQIFNVEVPQGSEPEIERLRGQANLLEVPTLYGLNAREALIDANILMFHDYPFGELRGNNIIIGFVDTGIDYTHKVFQNADNTTRIVRIWDQTLPGNPPPGYLYGSQYTEEDLNRAIQSGNPYEIVPTRDDIGHGTFLAGVAAGDDKTGNNEYRGGAPDALIAMVKLRPATDNLKAYYLVREEAIAYQENDFIAGISYLLQIALELQKPLVICVGMGNNTGAHDGTAIVERYLNSLSVTEKLVILVAAGNEANSGHHFSGKIATGEIQNVEMNVSEGEKGFFLNVWGTQSDRLAVSMRSPVGQVIEKVPLVPERARTYKFSLEQTVITVIYNYPEPQTGGENIIIRFENPTPGLWALSIYGEEIIQGFYNMWLPRSGFIGEETRFLRSDALVTVGIPGTGENMITIGAYDYIDQSVYVGSGRGPAADNQMKPEIIAPGVNIEGPRVGGGYTTFVGTSSAAAVTASAAALLMQWAVVKGNLQQMNTRVARGILIRGAARRRGAVYPNPAEGYGRLDLRGSITSI